MRAGKRLTTTVNQLVQADRQKIHHLNLHSMIMPSYGSPCHARCMLILWPRASLGIMAECHDQLRVRVWLPDRVNKQG